MNNYLYLRLFLENLVGNLIFYVETYIETLTIIEMKEDTNLLVTTINLKEENFVN